ncbi:hypothetical protein Tco_1507042 [Tanacetum coccineum]
MSAKDSITTQTCELLQGEFNDFLALYPIPFEYHVILPKSNQTVFDAATGYVGLYTHSFSLANLRLLLTEFFCEPMVVSPLSTSFEGFLICVELYPQLLSEQNKLDLKSFKDKRPPNIEENPMLQHLSRYPTSVRVFRDHILFLAGLKPSWEHGQQRPAIMAGKKELAFRNFIYTEDDDDLDFLPKEPSLGFGIGSPSASVNTKPPKDVKKPEVQPAEVIIDSRKSLKAGVFLVHPRSVAARIKERKYKTRGGSSRPPVKRKLASGSSSSRAVRAKTSASKDDAPFLSISDVDEGLPDCFKLKDANAVVDNVVNRRAHEFLQVIKKMSDEADVIMARERSREEECEGLRVKCEASMAEFDQNTAVLALRDKISSMTVDVNSLEADKARLEAVEVSLRREVEELKQDRRDVVSKVVPYVSMELVHSDELGRLVGKLVSSAITYGRCRAYEQVAAMKEPFDLSKAKGYHSSYQKDHTQASNDFFTSTFPWLDEFLADATTLIKTLLSKKPPMLQKLTPSRTQMPVPFSQKATLSSAPSSNPMSPPPDLVKPFPSPLE